MHDNFVNLTSLNIFQENAKENQQLEAIS